MNRRLLRASLAGGMVAALAIAGIGTASADPNPGTQEPRRQARHLRRSTPVSVQMRSLS